MYTLCFDVEFSSVKMVSLPWNIGNITIDCWRLDHDVTMQALEKWKVIKSIFDIYVYERFVVY